LGGLGEGGGNDIPAGACIRFRRSESRGCGATAPRQGPLPLSTPVITLHVESAEPKAARPSQSCHLDRDGGAALRIRRKITKQGRG
jgi:hypothetical protein